MAGFYVLCEERSGTDERTMRLGCRGGTSCPPEATARNVGHGVSPGSAQRPSRRK
jgi:hypothetical protein